MFFVVYRQASNINMLKDGMTIEATHVKKKQLHHYLSPELVQRKKKVKESIIVFIVKIRDVKKFHISVFSDLREDPCGSRRSEFFYCIMIENAHMALGY